MAASESVRALEGDLRAIFGTRLLALVTYRPVSDDPGTAVPTLATVESLTIDDLRACAWRAEAWHDAGFATPLIIPRSEFARALDAFPLEFGAIIANHTTIVGDDPFAALAVDAADLRRACEVQARSHLLHLREGYIESRGRGDMVAELMADSVAPLAGLVKSVARLMGSPARTSVEAAGAVERAAGLPTGSLSGVLAFGPHEAATARERFPSYLSAVEALTRFVDAWSHA